MNSQVPVEHIVAMTRWRHHQQRPTYYRLVNRNGELVFERVARRRLPTQRFDTSRLLTFRNFSVHGVRCSPATVASMHRTGLLQHQPDSVREVVVRYALLEEL